jgi:hypothetical protein
VEEVVELILVAVEEVEEQVDYRTGASFSVCGATPYPITVGAAGTAGPAIQIHHKHLVLHQYFSITSAGGGGYGSRTSVLV